MLKVNPLRNDPQTMPLKDAIIVALILTMASFFTVFYPTLVFTEMTVNPSQAVFYAVGFIGGQFFTNLVVLAGLSKYTNSRYKENN